MPSEGSIIAEGGKGSHRVSQLRWLPEVAVQLALTLDLKLS
jgi:hypothetical protein